MEIFSENDIISYDRVFDNDSYFKITNYISDAKWRYGHGSYPKDDISFWIMELNDNEFFTKILLEKINTLVGKKFSLDSVYANGHTYGTKGRPHQDWYDKTGYTFLYYPNSSWDLEWGGKTIFILDRDKYFCKLPKPNCAVLFPGRIWHYAEETSRLFTSLRVTIAWKLTLED